MQGRGEQPVPQTKSEKAESYEKRIDSFQDGEKALGELYATAGELIAGLENLDWGCKQLQQAHTALTVQKFKTVEFKFGRKMRKASDPSVLQQALSKLEKGIQTAEQMFASLDGHLKRIVVESSQLTDQKNQKSDQQCRRHMAGVIKALEFAYSKCSTDFKNKHMQPWWGAHPMKNSAEYFKLAAELGDYESLDCLNKIGIRLMTENAGWKGQLAYSKECFEFIEKKSKNPTVKAMASYNLGCWHLANPDSSLSMQENLKLAVSKFDTANTLYKNEMGPNLISQGYLNSLTRRSNLPAESFFSRLPAGFVGLVSGALIGCVSGIARTAAIGRVRRSPVLSAIGVVVMGIGGLFVGVWDGVRGALETMRDGFVEGWGRVQDRALLERDTIREAWGRSPGARPTLSGNLAPLPSASLISIEEQMREEQIRSVRSASLRTGAHSSTATTMMSTGGERRPSQDTSAAASPGADAPASAVALAGAGAQASAGADAQASAASAADAASSLSIRSPGRQ
jgi:hypothetical protein